MTKIILLVIVLLFWAACGTAGVESAETTTEVITTTQAETTAEIATTEYELPDWWELPALREIQLNDAITLFEIRHREWNIFPDEIWVRNITTAEETLLFEQNERGAVPALGGRINDRFFTFGYYWEGSGPFETIIFDFEQQREVAVFLNVHVAENERIYVHCETGWGVEPYEVPVYYFYAFELESAQNNNDIYLRYAGMTVDMLWERIGWTLDGLWQRPSD
jgi:hypothetical protein